MGFWQNMVVKAIEYLLNNNIEEQISDIKLDVLNSVKDEYMTFYYNAWENDDAKSAMYH